MKKLFRSPIPTAFVVLLALTVTVWTPDGAPFLLGAAAQDEPIAVVMKVQGDVELIHGGSDPVPAAVGASLSEGDRVVPGRAARAIVVHRTGQKQEITESTVMQAPRTGERGDGFDRTVRVLAQAANSNARTSPNRQGMIRPLPGQAVKVAPRLGIIVPDTRPTFIWRSFDGADGYTIQIRRAGGSPTRHETSDTSFAIPTDAPPLERGATYYWTIAPSNTNRPAQEDSLEIASAETVERVEEGMEAIASMGFDPSDDGRLMAAVILTDLGLYYAAAEEIEALESTGPLSPDVLMLKGEVLNALGRVEEASKAFDMADATSR